MLLTHHQPSDYTCNTVCSDFLVLYYYYYYHHIKCIQQKHTSAYANSALYSSYIINQSCNVQLIQIKAAKKYK